MKKNYWQEYWESYFNFMALYLSELRNRYPNADIKHEYTEVAKLFEYRNMEFRIRNAARDCRKLTIEQIRESLEWIFQTDLKLKSTRTQPRILLEELLSRLLLTASQERMR